MALKIGIIHSRKILATSPATALNSSWKMVLRGGVILVKSYPPRKATFGPMAEPVSLFWPIKAPDFRGFAGGGKTWLSTAQNLPTFLAKYVLRGRPVLHNFQSYLHCGSIFHIALHPSFDPLPFRDGKGGFLRPLNS